MPMLFLSLTFRVLSNGALVFAVSLILCTGKWIKLFADTYTETETETETYG